MFESWHETHMKTTCVEHAARLSEFVLYQSVGLGCWQLCRRTINDFSVPKKHFESQGIGEACLLCSFTSWYHMAILLMPLSRDLERQVHDGECILGLFENDRSHASVSPLRRLQACQDPEATG